MRKEALKLAMILKRFSILFFLGFSFVPSAFGALLVDDFDGNGLSGHWTSYADPHSYASPNPFHFSGNGHDSDQCARLEFEMKPGLQYPYAGMMDNFPAQNLSTYEGVRFWAKSLGTWSCMLPIPATAADYNHYSAPFFATAEWKLFEIPFAKFGQVWGTKKPWDPSVITGVQFSAGGNSGDKGWLSVDDIEFYKKGEEKSKNESNNPILKDPKVNQDGYLPSEEKYFALTESTGVKKGDAFQILNQGGKTAFSGNIQADSIDDKIVTGEKVFRVDFSGLTLPGRYTVSVDNLKSVPFVIKGNVYESLFRDSLRCFYLIRCGTAINDKVTGINHEACHLKDAPFKTDPGKSHDFTGGWHNAGDYGKWTHMEAISCAWMMWLYE
ncbi:MAG TPA: glycoside hydrolase family 9 protein, partial [bacterium]